MNTSDKVPYRPYWAGSPLIFDNFVVGKSNQLALAEAKKVAYQSRLSSNPLFIYGDVGLGKTHLLQAIANQIRIDGPDEKVCYVPAMRLVEDVILAYKTNKFDDFKDFYCELDVLLIDDVQFFSGKRITQEKLLYAFDELVGAGKQIILAGNTHPNELLEIDPGLISRFGGGVTVALGPLDLDTRVEILLRKSFDYEMPICEEVAHYIAERATENIRELEGTLKTVIAHAKINKLQITVDLVEDVFVKLIPARPILAAEVVRLDEQNSETLESVAEVKDDCFLNFSRLIADANERINRAMGYGEALSGIATCFPSLDHYTSGLQRGQLIVVAGRPSMAKRDLVRNIAMHIALDNKLPVAIVENETGGVVLATNMIASIAKIHRHRLSCGDVADDETDRMLLALNVLHKAPIHYSSLTPVSERELGEQLRGLEQRVSGLGLVVVDCFSELKLCGEQMNDNYVSKVIRISRYLKDLAKELNVPVIVLSPVNREIEDRCNKWPTLTDLPGMAAIANAADLVLMIYRDEVYEPESKEQGTAQIIVSKNLDGPIGVISLQYDGRHGDFEEKIHGQLA